MFWLPMGVDRADGVTDLPSQPKDSGGAVKKLGTPDPEGKLVVFGDDERNKIQQVPEYPKIERAEQGTFQNKVKTAFANALFLLSSLSRGTFVKDTGNNVWRILSSGVDSIRGGYAELSYTAESISFDSPPDDFDIQDVNLGVDILKHPRYAWALLPYTTDQSTYINVGGTDFSYAEIKETIVRLIQAYRDSPFFPNASNINGLVQTNILSQIKNGVIQVHWANPTYDPALKTVPPLTWDGNPLDDILDSNCVYFVVGVPVDLRDVNDAITIALAAAKEILFKLWRQEDTPPIAGYEITWSQYYFRPTFLNPGNYIENPFGIVPMYFMSPSQDGTNSIFDEMILDNPQCYSSDGTTGGVLDLSCLRCPDKMEYQRTWFKVTRKWLCSPIGHWDRDLLSGGERPQDASDFNVPF